MTTAAAVDALVSDAGFGGDRDRDAGDCGIEDIGTDIRATEPDHRPELEVHLDLCEPRGVAQRLENSLPADKPV